LSIRFLETLNGVRPRVDMRVLRARRTGAVVWHGPRGCRDRREERMTLAKRTDQAGALAPASRRPHLGSRLARNVRAAE
jgi:hypothetical protein